MSKNTIIFLVIVLIIVIAVIWFFSSNAKPPVQQNGAPQQEQQNQQAEQPSESTQQNLSTYDIQGMKVEVLKEGTGPEAKVGDTVSVHYTGTLLNGTKFDSSVDRGQPFSFVLGQNRVIKGWELGVLGMKVGEKRKLTIPPELAYGNQAVGGVIPANSTLVFDVELLGINK